MLTLETGFFLEKNMYVYVHAQVHTRTVHLNEQELEQGHELEQEHGHEQGHELQHESEHI